MFHLVQCKGELLLNETHGPLDTSAAKIKVGTANGKVATSAAKATLPIPQLAEDSPTTGYIMLALPAHSLVLDPYVTQTVP